MSKSKRAKSGSAHDVTRWENGLVQAALNEDAWKTCVFFLVGNKLEDNPLIDVTCGVVSTGLRKLFSVITKEVLFKEVKEFVKASASGGGKGKQAVKLPEFVEVCEQVKPFIDQDEDIPPTLLAKLLKFKLLHLKAKDFERREAEKKAKDVGNKKPGGKRSASPGKGSKSPKRKGKKAEPEVPPSPKKDTKLKKRGEVEDTFKTIDDEPDEEGSPQHYILIHGFTVASTLQHLSNIGVHVDAIIKVKQDEYQSMLSPVKEKSHENVEVEEVVDENGVSQLDETDEITNQQKEDVKLAMFWKESDELVMNAPTGHKLKDVGKYEVVVSNTLAGESPSDVDVDKKNELGTDIFEKIANVCFDMLDHQKSYQRYLDAMKLLHIPLHAPCNDLSEPSHSQSAVPSLATDIPKEAATPVEIDMRYYNHLVSSIPDESISVSLILHCVLEQVVASVEETSPMDKKMPLREDGLDNELAAYINARTAYLALSAEEKQEVLQEPDHEKNQRENVKTPQILDYNDNLSQRLHYLEDLTVLDGLQAELSMLDVTTSRTLNEFQHRTTAESLEASTRFHRFVQHCSLDNPDEVSRILKNYAFEGMPLKSVDNNGDIREVHELNKVFRGYTNPWDDPYSDLTKYFSSLSEGRLTNDGIDHGTLSAAVNLVSFRNLDEWCYIEQFDKNALAQIFDEARHTNPYIDAYHHKHDDTLLVVFHNPVGKQLYNRSTWNVRLHSNVGFRNYLEHVSGMIVNWTRQQELLEEECNRTPTPIPPTPEPPQVQIKTGSRYGLKTRAEIAALKAEEEDKGKKKGKRSPKSRTPKSGKKSESSKRASANSEKKGSAQKNRATSGSLKTSKSKLGYDVEPELGVKNEETGEDHVYNFLGYDVGDDLLHVTGVQSSMFPSDGGEIRIDKTTYVHQASTVTTSVYKDGNILKLHFLQPLDELLEEEKNSSNPAMKEQHCEQPTREESHDSHEDVLEKSEFEENEKQCGSQSNISGKPTELEPPVFCKHASFTALLNDGMRISSSGFGSRGAPSAKQDHSCPLEAGNNDSQQTGQAMDPGAHPKASSPKSKKKNDEEARKLEELRQAEEQRRAAEEEARKLQELQRATKKPFHEIFITCPDGLHVSYRNDETYSSVGDAGGVVVRQRYPVKSHGLHNCEAVRGKHAMKEKARCIRTDGTVIKIMSDNSVEVLYPDGMTSCCPIFPSKIVASQESLETAKQPSSVKVPINTVSTEENEPTDQNEIIITLQAEWTTVTSDGERFFQHLDGSKTNLEPVKLSVATCPVTNQIYKTREDNVITVIRPNGTQVVEHSDGTRITTFFKEIQTEIIAANQNTGEEAKYESHLCRHIKVECEGFATVVIKTEDGSVETLFGNGSKVKTQPNGNCALTKSDGSQLHFDIKGNVSYVPYKLPCTDRLDLNLASVTADSKERCGVYFLRTTSQHCCETTDERGNTFSAFANGEIKITYGSDEHNSNSTPMKEVEQPESPGKDAGKPLGIEALSSLPSTSHVPRYFVMRRDGSGFELLRHQDVGNYLEDAEKDTSVAVIRTPVGGYPGANGITVLKPFTGGIGKTWLLEKDEKILIPEGLRERDFKLFPSSEFKKIGPTFISTAGAGINIGNMKKRVETKPQLTCPKVLMLRHLVKYEPLGIVHRQNISAAFRKYGDYVTACQLQLDNLLPYEPRSEVELEKAKELSRKFEPLKCKISDDNALTEKYLKSITPAEEPPAPPPVWKRPPGEWERDRIELAKLEYGKHALRHHEVPPYFETSQGQAFLAGLKNIPDMKKLTADLDKNACPDRPPSNLSGSSSPDEPDVQGPGTQGNRNDSNVSAVLENLDHEGRNSPSDRPVESSTPFASRPVNPTPAQAAGGPTPTSVRPTNPTPAKASNVIGYENNADSPRVNNVHSTSDYTPLEALLETRNEESFEKDDYRMDNDTALDLNSSVDSQYNEETRVKSLYFDVTGSPRKDRVNLPNAILGSKPGALPNTQFSTIEEPVRRKVQTVSVAGKDISTMRGFELLPPEIDFGVLKEGCTYMHSVTMKNIGIDSCRFKIRQPPPSTGMKVLFTPGPVAAGMSTQLNVEIFAVAVGVSGESGIGSIGHHIEIVGETDIIYLPVSAIILTGYEYHNRSPTAPQGGPSQGTRMVSNRPPSREAIRPRRDHLYSNGTIQF